MAKRTSAAKKPSAVTKPAAKGQKTKVKTGNAPLRRSALSRSALAAGVQPFFPVEDTAPPIADLAELIESMGEGKRFRRCAAANEYLPAFLDQAMQVSPFLRQLILDDPVRLLDFLEADPRATAETICQRAASAWIGADEAELMRQLRRARGEIALLTALADLGGVFDVATVTEVLTDFADAAVSSAACFLLREEHDAGRLVLKNPAQPDDGCGWIILGMGKFGASELNYSSDIDLIVFYEREIAPLAEDTEPAKIFVRMTRRLVHILNERTGDGYVFRVDLRLRPDPSSTAVAISADAALQYYESQGQNWERAALIKARPVAGDRTAGDGILHDLRPYIWRKYLDFAAIADIHSIKRQIHDHRGHGEIAVAGHNVKLGRGGIREIEFFVQTQQLIAGGREPALRGRRTIEMLGELARLDWIGEDAVADLTRAYETLRRIEHRLQMVADEQTHTLPEAEEDLLNIARMSGQADTAAFSDMLLPELERVRRHYQRLFEAAPTLSANIGSLVFTGDDDDPDTIATLERLGFARPSDVIRSIRQWHFGRYPAMRSATARERLTEITPALLEALSGSDNADAAFAAFDRFLARLPAGVQLFALLGSHPDLLRLLASIMGSAPRLADIVIRRAHVLDSLIEPAFFGRIPDRETLAARLDSSLSDSRGFEDTLDRARIFGQEQDFLIGVRLLGNQFDIKPVARAYTSLAELLIDRMLGAVLREFETAHGKMPGGKVAVLALGKLGGGELTAASDVDLILLYDFSGDDATSNGARPLNGAQYYARLTQRLVAALSVQTAEGKLYDVDFRLRPSGNAGPLATRFKAFVGYQAKEAWTWEHMALTRARPIAGDPDLCRKVAAETAKVLRAKRDRRKIIADVLDMRALVEKEKGEGGSWDIKQAPGGLVDIEFIAQTLQLLDAAEHPKILDTQTEAALTAAARFGVLPANEADILLPALRLYQSLMQLTRLCLAGSFIPEEAPKGFLDLLAAAAGLPDFRRLDAHLRETETAVRASFVRLVGTPKPKKSG